MTAKTYRMRPSELLNIRDEYTAFCLDEACALIQTKMEQGEEPKFIEDVLREAEEKEKQKTKPRVDAWARLEELQKQNIK